MVGTGTALVRLDLVSSPAPLAGDFTVQIGAFQQRGNADRLRTQMAARYPVFLVDYDAPDGHYYRVRVGREPSQEAAQRLAARLAAEGGFQTFVVRLDEVH
jgi:rare lipoprotein A